jgi:hypothetical protein
LAIAASGAWDDARRDATEAGCRSAAHPDVDVERWVGRARDVQGPDALSRQVACWPTAAQDAVEALYKLAVVQSAAQSFGAVAQPRWNWREAPQVFAAEHSRPEAVQLETLASAAPPAAWSGAEQQPQGAVPRAGAVA